MLNCTWSVCYLNGLRRSGTIHAYSVQCITETGPFPETDWTLASYISSVTYGPNGVQDRPWKQEISSFPSELQIISLLVLNSLLLWKFLHRSGDLSIFTRILMRFSLISPHHKHWSIWQRKMAIWQFKIIQSNKIFHTETVFLPLKM